MASVAHAQGAKRGLFGLKRNSVYGSDMTLNGDGDQAVARSSSKKNQIATENVGAGLGLRPTPERKIIVIGNAGAGKTAMLTVYMTGTFPVEYLPTIFETTNTAVKVDGKDIKLSLWDTAGQEDYARLRALCYSNASAIICCFAVNDRDSFIEVEQRWYPEARHFCPRTPIILVGTKCDLRGSAEDEDGLTDDISLSGDLPNDVSTDEAKALAKRLELTAYMECSARTQQNLREVFDIAVRKSLAESQSFSSTDATQKPKTKKKKECTIL